MYDIAANIWLMNIVFLGPIFSVILPLMYKVGMQRKFAPATIDHATITEIVNY